MFSSLCILLLLCFRLYDSSYYPWLQFYIPGEKDNLHLAGTYDYADVSATGDPVWARHDNCRCLIEYVADRRERVNNYRRR